MRGLFTRFVRRGRRSERDTRDVLASLILAAREDIAFRDSLLAILHLPPAQREPLVKTAVEQMALRGEPLSARAAFLMLASDHGARTALELLDAGGAETVTR